MSNTTKTPKTEATIRMEERARFRDIMTSDEGRSHPKAALKMALYSNMSPDMIRDMLADMPSESPFLAAMDREGAIGIGSPLGALPADDPKQSRMAELAAAATRQSLANGFITPAEAKARGLNVKA